MSEETPALSIVSGAVVAIVAVAGWRFGRTAVRDRFTAAVAVGALAGEWPLEVLRRRWPWLQPELVVLGAAAVLGPGDEVRTGVCRQGTGRARARALSRVAPPGRSGYE